MDKHNLNDMEIGPQRDSSHKYPKRDGNPSENTVNSNMNEVGS